MSRKPSITNPLKLLKNPKEAPSTLEVKLNEKKLVTLEGFETFTGLQTLEIRSNQLTSFAGLAANTALTCIDATSNQLEALDVTQLAHMTNLSKLMLAENKLQDLDAVLSVLEQLPALKECSLMGNPLAAAADSQAYRDTVALRLVNLETLDGQPIADERAAAFKRLEPPPPPPELEINGRRVPDVRNDKPLLERLKALLREMRITIKKRRILLKPDFQDIDRRKEECVPETNFLQILDLYGLLPKPKSLENLQTEPGQIVANVSDVAILLAFYGSQPPKRCRSLGRDKIVKDLYFVDYVSFCRDVEPKVGGRDADNRDRLLELHWKDKAPAISECLRRLRRDVQVVKVRIGLEREEAWRALASAGAQRPSSDSWAPYNANKLATSSLEGSKFLGPWEMAELKKLLAGKDPGKTGMLTCDDVIKAVQAMRLRGWRLAADRAGESMPTPELAAAMEAVKKQPDGRLSWKDFMAGIEGGEHKGGPFSALHWVKLSGPEALQQAQDLYKEATSLQSTLSLGSLMEAEAKELEKRIQQLSQLATRLEAQAHGGMSSPLNSSRRAGTSHGLLRSRTSSSNSSSLMLGIGRNDFVKMVTYPSAASSTPHAAHGARSSSSQQHRRTRSLQSSSDGLGGVVEATRKLKAQFAVSEDLLGRYLLKRELKAGPRKPFPTNVAVV